MRRRRRSRDGVSVGSSFGVGVGSCADRVALLLVVVLADRAAREGATEEDCERGDGERGPALPGRWHGASVEVDTPAGPCRAAAWRVPISWRRRPSRTSPTAGLARAVATERCCADGGGLVGTPRRRDCDGSPSSYSSSPRSAARPTTHRPRPSRRRLRRPPTDLTFAVYGPKPVIDAYKRLAAAFSVEHDGVKVAGQGLPDPRRGPGRRSVQATKAGDAPDLFLMNHDDLAGLTEDKAVRRVDDLLADREVDFGDGYTRNGLEAFSADAALQCMPVDVSPLVVYYNPEADRARPDRRTGQQARDPGGRLVARRVRPGRPAAAPPRRPWPLRRPRPRAGRAVHLVGRRPGRRRHRRADDPHPLRRRPRRAPSRSCWRSCATRR